MLSLTGSEICLWLWGKCTQHCIAWSVVSHILATMFSYATSAKYPRHFFVCRSVVPPLQTVTSSSALSYLAVRILNCAFVPHLLACSVWFLYRTLSFWHYSPELVKCIWYCPERYNSSFPSKCGVSKVAAYLVILASLWMLSFPIGIRFFQMWTMSVKIFHSVHLQLYQIKNSAFAKRANFNCQRDILTKQFLLSCLYCGDVCNTANKDGYQKNCFCQAPLFIFTDLTI